MDPRRSPGLVLLALAHELLVWPELLAAFARCFGDRPDVRLLVWGQTESPASLESALVPLVGRYGLDAEGAAEVVALAQPAGFALEQELVGAAHCLLTRRPPKGPLCLLARFDDLTIDELLPASERAERARRQPVTSRHRHGGPTTSLQQVIDGLQEPFIVQRDDPVRGVIGNLQGDDDNLFLFFSGLDPESPLPLRYHWAGFAQRLGHSSLVVRDHAQAWYHRGVAQLGTSIAETAASLRALMHELGARRLVCVGGSAGAYAALRFGALLGADEVHAFAPQTSLDPTTRASLGDTRWAEQIERLQLALPAAEIVDLAPRLRNNRVPTVVHFSADEPRDVIHAHRLAACANVDLRAYANGGHGLAAVLRDDGRLETILAEAGGGRAPRRVARAAAGVG